MSEIVVVVLEADFVYSEWPAGRLIESCRLELVNYFIDSGSEIFVKNLLWWQQNIVWF